METLKNQNVLFITRTLGLGGTENVVLQLCELLSGKVNRLVVCSSGGIHEQKLQEMGIKTYLIPDIVCKNPFTVLNTYRSIKNIIKKEQITMVHSHHRMAALYAEIAAHKGIIKVANAHNTFQDKKLLTKFAYRNTNIIAVGEMVRKNLIEFFEIPDRRINVIYNAVKPFKGLGNDIPVLNREKEKRHILIGNIGRLSEQKGMTYFIDAAEIVIRSHPEARFVIVGDGELKGQLEEYVKSKQLQDTFLFLGYRNDIQNVISQLDFIVISSLWEGLPLTPIEAFSVKKTVIGTAVDGTVEIIKNQTNGLLIEPKNYIQLAEKMNYLINNRQDKTRLEENAFLTYKRKFSFNTFSKAYLTYYEGLLGKMG